MEGIGNARPGGNGGTGRSLSLEKQWFAYAKPPKPYEFSEKMIHQIPSPSDVDKLLCSWP